MKFSSDSPAATHCLKCIYVCLCVCVCADLLAVGHVAGQQQDLGGREGGGQRQTVLLLSDLLPVSVHPLLETENEKVNDFIYSFSVSHVVCQFGSRILTFSSSTSTFASALFLISDCEDVVIQGEVRNVER